MNYSVYRFSKVEVIKSMIIWVSICAVFAYFFYRSIIAFFIMLLFFPIFFKYQRKKYIDKRKWNLCLSFQDYIYMVAVNISSGNSVENSFVRAYPDICETYGKEADISKEVNSLIKGLDNNVILEDILNNLGERSNVEEIKDFADIFSAAKRTGGNLKEIIEDTSAQISNKIEMKRELKTVIAEKEFEHKVMCLVPFLILVYIGLTNKGYFDPLYKNTLGIAVMTGCLIAYLVAFIWGEKITRI